MRPSRPAQMARDCCGCLCPPTVLRLVCIQMLNFVRPRIASNEDDADWPGGQNQACWPTRTTTAIWVT
jgi:hypothetical protein